MELGWAEMRFVERLAQIARDRQRRAEIALELADLDVVIHLAKWSATRRRPRVN